MVMRWLGDDGRLVLLDVGIPGIFRVRKAKKTKLLWCDFFLPKKTWELQGISFMTWPFGYGSNTKFTSNKGCCCEHIPT